MNPIRRAIIRRSIAQLLKAAKPMLYPVDQLAEDVKMIVMPIPTRMEFDQVIDEMERARQIILPRGDDNVVKTKLTEVGEAEL